MRSQTRDPADIGESLWERAVTVDLRVTGFLGRYSLTLLRISLAVVFVWFGALKVFGVTPVTDLVTEVVYWVDPSWFVPVLGAFEVLVGLGLLSGIGMRLVLLLLVAQLVGTFLVLVVRPDLAFQNGNPLLLTTEGEFVVKNLVLISAGLTVGSQVPRLPSWKTPRESQSLGEDARRTGEG
ncbi:MAG: DoxX family membrane protein [Acidimicrobiia bacterium]